MRKATHVVMRSQHEAYEWRQLYLRIHATHTPYT